MALCLSCGQSLAMLVLAIPTNQWMATNLFKSSQVFSDRINQYVFNTDSVGGYYPAPLALLFVLATVT